MSGVVTKATNRKPLATVDLGAAQAAMTAAVADAASQLCPGAMARNPAMQAQAHQAATMLNFMDTLRRQIVTLQKQNTQLCKRIEELEAKVG